MGDAGRGLEGSAANRARFSSARPRPDRPSLGQETTDRIRGALGYVPSVARRYIGGGLDFDEMIAAGNLGLVQAALRFDSSRKVRFVTYADWWIRKTILEALEDQRRLVRLPRNQSERLRRVERLRNEWKTRHGSEPTLEQLARESGVPRLAWLLRASLSAVSLDHPVRGGQSPLSEQIADPDAECPQGNLVQRERAGLLRQHLETLAPRELAVIRHRFGLDDQPPGTLREVAAVLGISRERVRQVELRALIKLRARI